VLAAADFVDLFPNELASLGRRGLSLPLIAAGFFNSSLQRHFSACSIAQPKYQRRDGPAVLGSRAKTVRRSTLAFSLKRRYLPAERER
jgi:hypothetical protein